MPKILTKKWISATATHHYFQEPLLDWFKYAGKPGNGGNQSVKTNNFLMEQGNQFEASIIKLIYKKITSVYDVNGLTEARNEDKAKETWDAMKKGYTIILNGVLHNSSNKTYGVSDILIRSDKIHKLIKTPPPINKTVAPKIGHKWHYCVIDIKYQTLMLKSDGKNLLNSGLVPSYKAQLCIYNEALGKLQGYTPKQAYLLGRRWVYQQNGIKYFGNDCFDRLGQIDYADGDAHYKDLTKKALKWINLCKSAKAKKWNVTTYPLTRSELYPNMCNQYDQPWHEQKKQLAEKNHELTELWQVGKKNRDAAISQGVYDWMNPKCTAEILNVGGSYASILNKIIAINQSDDSIRPAFIKTNLYDWKEKGKEYFVDFEFKNAVFDTQIQLPIADTTILLTQIGVGYYDKKWHYKHFTVDRINEDEEYKICKQFLKWLPDNVKCWHWSNAEEMIWNNILMKYKKLDKQLLWCDMLKLFQQEPIVIKGALNFKLKSVAGAMYRLGLIKTTWSQMDNGQLAMVKMVELDQLAERRHTTLNKLKEIKELIRYNEVDVKVMYEMLTHLRTMTKRKRE